MRPYLNKYNVSYSFLLNHEKVSLKTGFWKSIDADGGFVPTGLEMYTYGVNVYKACFGY